ncbi:MAG: hypothetical protein V7608_5405 [Hyphomicrobiales bacterium]|jgi:medium-chain acyl-[acyl-carrier-protein] hydrolase
MSLLPLRQGGTHARKRLYCLPYAGGSAGIYRSWPELVSPDINIWGVEYPGHGSRIGESLVDCVEKLADSVANAIAAERTPYVLFGHSMGSLVAFETCHRLATYNAGTPELLVVSGHRAPRLPPSTPSLHAAPDAEFIAHLRELGATPPEVFGSSELLELMLPILRSDFRACETYAPPARSPLHIPIAVYGGLADKDTSCDSLRAWKHETTRDCVVRMFSGGHFFLRDSASRVAAVLEHDLANAFTSHRADRASGDTKAFSPNRTP